MKRPFSRSVPAISVVLPTYNQADFLPAAFESVLVQTWDDFELIIVNDGSTDNTQAVLQSYLHHPRIRIITQPNKKLPGALNSGFAVAKGRYLTWTSSGQHHAAVHVGNAAFGFAGTSRGGVGLQ